MPFAEHFAVSGLTLAAQTATLPATININAGFEPTRIEIINTTQFGQTGTGFLNIQKMWWNYLTPTVTYLEYINAAGTSILTGVNSVNAISTYNAQESVLLGPAITGTTITKANPAVATAAAHGLQTGDLVQISNNVVMKQLGGLWFTITVTGANTFTIPLNTNVANFTAETGFIVRKVIVPPLFYPKAITISGISNASPMVISTLSNHGLTVGQKIKLNVPAIFGMPLADKVQGVITAVTATTITLGAINSSAFGTFTWPVGGAGFSAFTPAQVIPFGSGPSVVATPPYWYDDKLDDAETNIGYKGFTIGTGLLRTATAGIIGVTANDVLAWTAFRDDV